MALIDIFSYMLILTTLELLFIYLYNLKVSIPNKVIFMNIILI
uniref:Uncharacterized protein n=1 Tax=Podoviridae sp. ctZkC8 TaxID=2825259 RepID=A0A8S5UBU3_9CAUD|nr:MAG TPA: hypothetical protein [Podoviridae sp. ctZkC8]